ncbi:hypothetical protein SELMODRAFT_422160 [Selaginella moellendorffii]|uniref:beta-N-acetylhexosaminidase n=1 Tax=Selaginella moellendorffii TaxID=88036 RepID=D8SHJ0_SELML|nr:hypothetical protein SELMODRAFT_422160 [Selaginella moellendorffii]
MGPYEDSSQICTYNAVERAVLLQGCPWNIFDEPRFSYRGLLIGCLALACCRRGVLPFGDSIVSKGSYSISQRYNLDDAKAIVKYARLRGIHVMPEIDVPGHARSWGVGYPELWPSENCKTPLDISKNFTFEVIDGIFSDLSKVFPFELLHIGGDEVNTRCWEITEPVNDWLRKHNLTPSQGYEFFVLQVQKLALKHGYVPVNWQEPFEKFGPSLSRKTIVHNWWGTQIPPNTVSSGLKSIVSEQFSWSH